MGRRSSLYTIAFGAVSAAQLATIEQDQGLRATAAGHFEGVTTNAKPRQQFRDAPPGFSLLNLDVALERFRADERRRNGAHASL